MSRKNNKLKKRMEFAQRIVVISWIVTVIWISFSFILAWHDKDTNSAVTVALVTESFGVTVGYFMYQAVLKNSRNKYGIDSSGVPYNVKQKLESVFGDELNTDSYNKAEG